MFHKVKFTTLNGCTHIFLDDMEVKGVISASLGYEINSVPVVRLVLRAKDAEVDADCANVTKTIADKPVYSLGISEKTVQILEEGQLRRTLDGETKMPIRTVGQLIEEYLNGRLALIKGIGQQRYTEITDSLRKGGYI